MWVSGSGDNRTVLATESSAWKSFPLEGSSYTGNAVYGLGPALGNSTYVVYSGSGNNVDVTGLDPLKTYRFTVLEGYNNSVTGSKSVYKYGGRSSATVNMGATSINSAGSEEFVRIRPNPAGNEVTLDLIDPRLGGTKASLLDMQGRSMKSLTIAQGQQKIEIHMLPAGLYFLRLANGAALTLVKL